MELGERVSLRMKDQGLSQAELARRVGLSQPSIFALIHKNKTGSRSLHRIARELKTTVAYLTGETDDPDSDVPASPEFSREERDWVDLLRDLPAEDRVTVLKLVRALGERHGPPTLHDQTPDFRAPAHG